MRLVVFGTVAAAVAGFAAYDKYDKNTNYQPVDARISDVVINATWRKSSAAVSRRRRQPRPLGCDLAELLTRAHPKWQGYAINHKIEIRFSYVSPVDGATHASSLTMSAFPKGQQLRAGDVLQVLASKTKTDKTRQL